MDPYSQKTRNYKLLAIVAIVVGLATALFVWLANHAYIEIKVLTNDVDKVTVELVDQKSLKSSFHELTPGTAKRILTTKGEKEVFAQNNGSSGLTVSKTGGFLNTERVELSLRPEKLRKFIGDNPEPCTQLVGERLFSYECSGNLSSIKLHYPATLDEPTFVKEVVGVDDPVTILGTMSDGKNLLVVSRGVNYGDDEAQSYSYFVSVISADGTIVSEGVIDALDSKKQYVASEFGDGLLLLDDSESSGISIDPSLKVKKDIKRAVAKDGTLAFKSFQSDGQNIVSLFTDEEESLEKDPHSSDTKSSGKSEIVVQNGGSELHISMNELFQKVVLCGKNKLCGLDNKRVRVFDISEKGAVYQYQITGALDILSSDSGVALFRNKGVVDFDTTQKSGSVDYDTGGYESCGAKLSSSSYLVCLINSRQDKSALYINRGAVNADSIDKKVLDVLDNKDIKTLSIYGQFVYITPELGEPQYIASLREYGFSSQARQAAAQSIQNSISKAGIDTSVYKIINTTP